MSALLKFEGGFIISNYQHQSALPVHSLYVGSRDGEPFPNADRQAVIAAVAASFDCFTTAEADGYFKGRSVATLIIKIGTEDTLLVEAFSYELGQLLDQEAIGLETAGTYRSISMASSTPPLDESTNYLATQLNSWADQLRASGRTVVEMEPQTDTGKYCVTFVPREGAPRIKIEMRTIPAEPCPSCGTILEPDGRCHACWGDVMGLCDTCNGILDDGFLCPTCAPTEHTIPTG